MSSVELQRQRFLTDFAIFRFIGMVDTVADEGQERLQETFRARKTSFALTFVAETKSESDPQDLFRIQRAAFT